MTSTAIRVCVLAVCLPASFIMSGCATVQPWQRGRLADPAMIFDEDASSAAYTARSVTVVRTFPTYSSTVSARSAAQFGSVSGLPGMGSA